YYITVTDGVGCISIANATITEPSALSLTSSSTPESSYGSGDGQVIANVSGGTTPYSYLWSPSGETNSVASGLGEGTYTLTVTDANNCTDSITTDVGHSYPIVIASAGDTSIQQCHPDTFTIRVELPPRTS